MIRTVIVGFENVLVESITNEYIKDPSFMYTKLSSQIDFRFFDHFRIKTTLFEILSKNKKDKKFVLFADSSMYLDIALSGYIYPLFDEVLSQSESNYSKEYAVNYPYVLKKYTAENSDTLFIEANLLYLQEAQKAGLQTINCNAPEALQTISKALENF